MNAATIMGFDDVIAATGVEYDEVTVWGRKVALLSITAGEVLEWVHAKESGDVEKKKEAGLLLLARSMVAGKENPTRLCDTPEKEQQMVVALKLKDSKGVNILVTRVLKMNGILDESADTAKND